MKGGLLVVLAVAAGLTGCQTLRNISEERDSRNVEFGHAWISDQMFPAEINVVGSWTSRDWGEASLSQTDRVVKGQVGDYPVDGVVSGAKVYLLASHGGRYVYSIVLEMPSPNLLIGYYSRSIPYQSSNRRHIRLDRRSNQL
ncbi:MAG TPA: hypothetical protein VIS96_18280 [Terrimicrobiaceae bacterium]